MSSRWSQIREVYIKRILALKICIYKHHLSTNSSDDELEIRHPAAAAASLVYNISLLLDSCCRSSQVTRRMWPQLSYLLLVVQCYFRHIKSLSAQRHQKPAFVATLYLVIIIFIIIH